jgi:hypothetical protein
MKKSYTMVMMATVVVMVVVVTAGQMYRMEGEV